MSDATEALPDDLAGALALLAQERARRIAAETEAATAKAEAASAKALVSHSEALIARLKAGDRQGSSGTLRQPVRAQGAAPGADGARGVGSGRR